MCFERRRGARQFRGEHKGFRTTFLWLLDGKLKLFYILAFWSRCLSIFRMRAPPIVLRLNLEFRQRTRYICEFHLFIYLYNYYIVY